MSRKQWGHGFYTGKEAEMQHKAEVVWQSGKCSNCLSSNIKDKGSFDKCMDCGARMGLDFETNKFTVWGHEVD